MSFTCSFHFFLRLRFGNPHLRCEVSHLKASNVGRILGLKGGTPWWLELSKSPMSHAWHASCDDLFVRKWWTWKSKSLDFCRYIHVIVVSESFRPSVWYVWGYTKGASNTLFYWWGGINRHLLVPSVQMLRLRMEEVGPRNLWPNIEAKRDL